MTKRVQMPVYPHRPPHSAESNGTSIAQLKLNQILTEIEKKTTSFPLLTPEEAIERYNLSSPSYVQRLIQEKQLFAFKFGKENNLKLPKFQFKEENSRETWRTVSRLCELLSVFNDWEVFNWMTTKNNDLGCTPAFALEDPKLDQKVIYLAGLYRNECTYSHLNFSKSNETEYHQ